MNEASTVTVTIPLPPQGASPNPKRSRWWEKSEAAAAYRSSTCLLATTELRKIGLKSGQVYAKRVRVSSEWWMGGKIIRVGRKTISDGLYRPKDQGNAIGALKAAYDGLVDAGLILDDQDPFLEVGRTVLHKRKDSGDRCEIVLTIEVLEWA